MRSRVQFHETFSLSVCIVRWANTACSPCPFRYRGRRCSSVLPAFSWLVSLTREWFIHPCPRARSELCCAAHPTWTRPTSSSSLSTILVITPAGSSSPRGQPFSKCFSVDMFVFQDHLVHVMLTEFPFWALLLVVNWNGGLVARHRRRAAVPCRLVTFVFLPSFWRASSLLWARKALRVLNPRSTVPASPEYHSPSPFPAGSVVRSLWTFCCLFPSSREFVVAGNTL